jgi:hypothetical protein
MRKKWLSIVLGVILAAAVVVGAVLMVRPRHPLVTRENYERIEVGMHRAEVENILGRPSRELTLRHDVRWDSDRPLGVASKEWPGASDNEDVDWTVYVWFKADDTVQYKHLGEKTRPPLLTQFQTWLQSLWPF